MDHRPGIVAAAEALATALLGMMAGFFFAFAIDVAPAMAQLDGPTYVATQQWINKVVRNLGFGAMYFGSAIAPLAVAALWALAGRRRRALGWLLTGAVYFAGVFWLTRSVNVPINDALALWSPLDPPAGWQVLRDRWNEANLWRAWIAAGCFAAALGLLVGRAHGVVVERDGPAAAA
jgi:uncharacterized membrane protein